MNSERLLEGILLGTFWGLFAGGGIWCLDRIKENYEFKSEEKRIIAFLEVTKNETDKLFRTTHRISSEFNITEEKVRTVCAKSKKIRRNQEKTKYGL